MHVLLVSQYYAPESGPATIRLGSFVRALEDAGHQVQVVTPVPSYPKGRAYEPYQPWKVYREGRILMTPTLVFRQRSALKRAVSDATQAISSVAMERTLLRRTQYDVVVASVPSPIMGLAAAQIAKIRSVPFVLDVRDVWPDILEAEGHLTSRPALAVLRWVEEQLLQHADAITVTARGDANNLENKGVERNRLHYVPNGADTRIFGPVSKKERQRVRAEYGWREHDFIATYSGSLNFAINDLPFLAELIMHHALRDVHFVVVGDGSYRKELQLASQNSSAKVTFLGARPVDEIPSVMAASDVALVPRLALKRDTGGNIPVKMFEAWACQTPTLFSGMPDTEAWSIQAASKAGIAVRAGDVEAAVRALQSLRQSGDDRIAFGRRGRTFVRRKFSRASAAKTFVGAVEAAVHCGTPYPSSVLRLALNS